MPSIVAGFTAEFDAPRLRIPMDLARFMILLTLASTGFVRPVGAALREPVHPRRNVEDFAAVDAKYVRFLVRATNRGEPCLDELEVYPSEGEPRNLALAANGARASASGSLSGYAIHQLDGLNDGRYGNGRSWIADRVSGAWAQIELPQATRIGRVVWGRDREGNFMDRLATEYEIQVATDTNQWRTVASSADREALTIGARLSGNGSLNRSLVNRFVPVGTSLSVDASPTSSEYRIDVWQTSDGLPGNTVTALQQTQDGYLWIGTLNGLVRFDGIRFKVFGESSELPNIRVLALLAARDGALWIGTEGGGLVRWQAGAFRVFNHQDGLPSETVMTLAEDGEGQIWAGTLAGLACWREGRFEAPPRSSVEAGLPVSGVAIDRENGLWVVTSGRLLLSRDRRQALSRPPAAEPSAFSSVLAAEAGRSGQLWFGGANGYIGAVSNGVVHVFREQPGQLLEATYALCEARNGDLWVGTANGGLRRLREGRFTSLTTQEGLSDNSVRCLLEDREGNLWVGTVGGGLNRVKVRKVTPFTTRDGLAHNVVMSLAEDNEGTVWVGSNCGGLSAGRDGIFSPFYANYLLDNECIWSLLPGSEGSLWVGTWGGGLFQIRGKEVRNYSVTRPGNDEPVVALAEDGSGGLWLGTMQAGLKRFRDGKVSAGPTGLPGLSHPVTSVVQDPGGPLWIGTSGGGLHRWHSGQDRVFSRREGLPSDFVRTLYRDGTGGLWIGTGGGLAFLRHEKLTAFTRAQGLPDEVISQILEDDRGFLWFGSNQGIFRILKAELQEVVEGHATVVSPVAYGRAEGMESLECTGGFHPSGLKTRDGRLWFSTVKGLVMVDPANSSFNETPPPVVIEEVRADGVVLAADSEGFSGRSRSGAGRQVEPALHIGPGTQRVDFRFTALSLVAPERNRFRYRLEGLEADWLEAGPQRTVAYPRLPPGRYTFHVAACNNDGVWNRSGASLAFQVRPHVWQTWWFRVAGLAAILGGGGWLVRTVAVHRLRRKVRRLQQEHAVERERTRIAQDIHDELGATLTRIALLTEVGLKHQDKPEEVTAALGKIFSTAREAVRAMDAIVWAVNPRNDSLDHFANYVSQYAEEFFRPTSIRCRLDIPADLPEHPLTTEGRHQLFLSVKEALNNVVRHSSATEVWLRLAIEEGQLSIAVVDNGRGIASSADAAGRHDGLGNIHKRVSGLGGRFEIRSSAEAGTELKIWLPLSGQGNTN